MAEKGQVQMQLNQEQIMGLIPHRAPFLLVDQLNDVEPGVSGMGEKFLGAAGSAYSPFDPALPLTVLIIENMAQTAAVVLAAHGETTTSDHGTKNRGVFLATVENIRFFQPLCLGESLRCQVTVVRKFRNMATISCESTMGGETVATGSLVLVIGGS